MSATLDAPRGHPYAVARRLASVSLAAGLPVLLTGHPGVGKSALAGDLARRLGLPLVDVRLAQREPAEICGIYFPDAAREALVQLAPPWAAAVCDRPALLFLDEINAAVTRLHQAAAYQLVLERRVGPRPLHPETRIVAAGNLLEDGHVVSPLSPALHNRFVHLQLEPCTQAWLLWADRQGLAPEVLAYFRSRPRRADELLFALADDGPFPSPRSWTMAGRLLAQSTGEDARALVAACVGAAAAEDFEAFLSLYRRVDPASVVKGAQSLDFRRGRNADPDFVHAVVMAVADWVVAQPDFRPAWGRGLARFLRSPGLDPEFGVVLLRQLRHLPRARRGLEACREFQSYAGELVQTMVGFDGA